MPRRPSRSGRKPPDGAGSSADEGCSASRIRVGGAGVAAALGEPFAGVVAAFGFGWAAGLAGAVPGFRRAAGLAGAFGAAGFAAVGFAAVFGFGWAAGLAATTFGLGWAAGFAAAVLGFRCATGLAGAFGAAGFAAVALAGTGFAAAGLVATGCAAAGFAAAFGLGVGVFETARGFEAPADAAVGCVFTVSSLSPSLGSACSALGRRG
jgi:hypothetical protein